MFKQFASGHNFNTEASRKVEVVIDEVLSNIIKHGYEGKDQNNNIHVVFHLISKKLRITFSDFGPEFNPLTTNQSISSKNIHEELGGWGILIMKNLVDNVSYKRTEEKNLLVVEKYVIF